MDTPYISNNIHKVPQLPTSISGFQEVQRELNQRDHEVISIVPMPTIGTNFLLRTPTSTSSSSRTGSAAAYSDLCMDEVLKKETRRSKEKALRDAETPEEKKARRKKRNERDAAFKRTLSAEEVEERKKRRCETDKKRKELLTEEQREERNLKRRENDQANRNNRKQGRIGAMNNINGSSDPDSPFFTNFN